MPDPKILGIDLETVSGILGILNDSGRNSVEKVSACRILSMENDEKIKEVSYPRLKPVGLQSRLPRTTIGLLTMPAD